MPIESTLALCGIFGLAGMMSGLSGFGFSAIGAVCLWLLQPSLAVPLLMLLSTANQLMSIGQLKADLKPINQWWSSGPAPFLLGGLIGAPAGVWVLQTLPAAALMLVFGAFLVGYAIYSSFKPASWRVGFQGDWRVSTLVGAIGGVVGGFTAFSGAAVVVWTGLQGLPKGDTRSIVQPYILGMQLVSLVTLAGGHADVFRWELWSVLLTTMPFVLPCTLLGVHLYRNLSDINFRRITFILLGVSGFTLVTKGLIGLAH